MDDAPLTHDEASELLALYALGSADDREERAVERHVTRCSRCHGELQVLIETSDALAWAVPQSALPAGVRSSILQAVDAERSAHRNERGLARLLRGGRRARWSLPAAMQQRAMIPMTACLAAAVIGLVVQADQLGDVQSGQPVAQEARSLTTSARVLPISTRGALDGVTAEYADVHGVGMIVTKGLPKPPSGYGYRIWGVAPDDAMRPLGILDPMTGGDEMALQPVQQPASDVTAIEITVEPLATTDASLPRPEGPTVGRVDMV